MTVARRRLSEYGAISAISEAELVAAYTAPSLEARPCLCGTVVIADPREPTAGVQLHQADWVHVAWRRRVGL